MPRTDRLDVFLRLSAALIGCVPVALYASLSLAAYSPGSDEVRAALGYLAPLPFYSLFGCCVARARTGLLAWTFCVGATVLLKLSLVFFG